MLRSAFKHDGDGTVVDETKLHHRAEFAFLDLNTRPSAYREKILVKLSSLLRRRGSDERRTAASAGVGQQGELGNDEQLAANGTESEVHLSGLVGKHPQTDDAIGKKIRVPL